MKIKYDANQKFQLDAINSVVDLFSGQPYDTEGFVSALRKERAGELFDYEVGAVGNNFVLGDEAVLQNLRDIQNTNGLPMSPELDGMNFSVEMETGTGKTYVYLRTIFELAKQYNFTKFIILVPSVAIKEGIKTSVESMREHFREKYALPFDFYVYDGKSPESVQSFATATNIQIMVMTIQGVKGNKNTLIMHQERDQLNGIKPIDYLAATNPIIIMDEPQNMEGELSKTAISDLNPLCTLRYSATHRNQYNLTYRLDPVDAHRMGLVKGITLASAQQKGSDAKAYLKLIETTNTPRMQAKIEVMKREKSGEIRKRIITVVQHADLRLEANNDAYENGYIINEISTIPQMIELSGHGTVRPEDVMGDNTDAVQREMIRETIREHMRREYLLREEGVKVLSLFFVDKVASYLEYDDDGNQVEGKFAKWFDEIYIEERNKSPMYAEILPDDPAEVRKAYFSEMKKGGVSQYVDSTGATKLDDDAYDLIMRGKERLLDMAEPARFIFSHSALKEGWDNPNVFQICMMRESNSELDRRQTIGRGLRLPVRQDGTRVIDKDINQLSVIADESYTQFATSLQNEYKKAGVKIGYVRHEEFAKIVSLDDAKKTLGFETSKKIWDHLNRRGMIDGDGKVLPGFAPTQFGFTLDLPDGLQRYHTEVVEIVQECKVEKFIGDTKNRKARTFNKEVLFSPELEDLWKKISRKTTYRVQFDRGAVIMGAIAKMKAEPPILPLRVSVEKNRISLVRGGVHNEGMVGERSQDLTGSYDMPNIVKELQEATSLTRATIIEILQASGRLQEFIHNPNDFMQMAKKCLRSTLSDIVIDGIEYEKLDEYVYELRELQRDSQQESERLIDQLYEVKNRQKSIVDYIVFDSNVEHDFAKYLDAREDVKLFLKLPDKFVVDTPVGNYNPDWAIVKHTDGGEKIYMVRETKGAVQEELLRGVESAKIHCATEHFKAIGIDNYAKVSPDNWQI